MLQSDLLARKKKPRRRTIDQVWGKSNGHMLSVMGTVRWGTDSSNPPMCNTAMGPLARSGSQLFTISFSTTFDPYHHLGEQDYCQITTSVTASNFWRIPSELASQTLYRKRSMLVIPEKQQSRIFYVQQEHELLANSASSHNFFSSARMRPTRAKKAS